MIASLFLILTRITQLIFLIPMIGMLSFLVHGYVNDNQLTPDFVLVIFIVSVLAGVWAAGTLVFYAIARHSGWFLALIDFGIFAAMIGAVAALRRIPSESCSNIDTTGYWALRETPFIYELPKVCNILKASFAFGIMEILFFAWSFVLCLFVWHHHRKEDRERPVRRETTEYRRSSRSRAPENRNYRESYYGGSRAGSRSGSRAPSRTRSQSRHGGQRSYYSDRRSYV